MKRDKTPKEFSKKIFGIVIALFIIIIAYSMVLMWFTQTTEALAYLIPSITTLAATTVGFYYNKAKVENRIKLAKEYNVRPEEIEQLENEVESEV